MATTQMANYSSPNNLRVPPFSPLITEEQLIIPIWLRDTYAQISLTPLYNLQGPLNETIDTEESAKELLNGQFFNLKDKFGRSIESRMFLSGGDIFGYINKNLTKEICDYTITIVIRGLRDLYWNHRQTLPKDEVKQLEIALRQPLPSFKNVFEYSSLNSINISLYQLFGTITPYSVIHIPVRHFIESININAPIRVALADTNVMIQLDYQQYDFWDFETKSLINYIDLTSTLSKCK